MFPRFVHNAEQLMQRLDSLKLDLVGLDLVGDEDGYPFSPFLHSKFTALIQKFKQAGNPWFGIRLHGGEGVKRGSSCSNYETQSISQRNFAAHMNIVAVELKHLLPVSQYQDAQQSLPCLRIGHGVAFSYPECLCVSPDGNFDFETSCDFPSHRAWLKEESIPLELNMTSNNTLLSDLFNRKDGPSDAQSVLSYFLRQAELSVVLSTDDDGVWPIRKCKEHYRHISVQHEFCQALLCGSLDEDDARKLVRCAWNNRFWHGQDSAGESLRTLKRKASSSSNDDDSADSSKKLKLML